MRAAIACSSPWLPISRALAIPLLLLAALAARAEERVPEKVYLDLDEALALAFPGAESWNRFHWVPDAQARLALERRLGWRLEEREFLIHEAVRGGESLGRALQVDQLGLYQPITSLVAVTPENSVRAVALMVFRESRGDAVKRRRFLRQYEGKTLRDPIRLNRDIHGITGATVSVRSMNVSVRKALAVMAVFGERNPS